MTETLILVRTIGDEVPGQTWYRLHDEAKSYDEFVQKLGTGLATDDPFAKAREYDVLEVQVTRRAVVKRSVQAIVNVEVLPQPVDVEEEAAA